MAEAATHIGEGIVVGLEAGKPGIEASVSGIGEAIQARARAAFEGVQRLMEGFGSVQAPLIAAPSASTVGGPGSGSRTFYVTVNANSREGGQAAGDAFVRELRRAGIKG